MLVHCEMLDHSFDLPDRPERIVCLTSGTTEALFAIGCGDRIVGVSSYCDRYVDDLDRPVIGDYLKLDQALLDEARPDLILVIGGIQHSLGRTLARQGLPVYCLPLPSSFHGILENIVTVAALVDEMTAGRQLCSTMTDRAAVLRRAALPSRARVYVELWFGRHVRTIGGRTFISDLVEIAGGDPIFGGSRSAYLKVHLDDVAQKKPEIMVGFSEPEYPVDFQDLLEHRGWDSDFAPSLILSDVTKGRNVIHDGPSVLDTAAWLQAELLRLDK